MKDIFPTFGTDGDARALFQPPSAPVEAGAPPREAGLYKLSQAARLAQTRTCTARIWIGRAKGSKQSSMLPRYFGAGIVRPPNDHGRALTFAELLTLRLVKGLLAEGFSRSTLRHVTARTAARFGSRTPLVTQRFRTEGARVLLELENARRAVACPDAGEMQALQHFLEGILERVLFSNVDWENGAPARWWPMGRSRSVLIDPAIRSGTPHVAATCCKTADLAKAVWTARGDLDEVAVAHDLSARQVRDAVQFEADRPKLH